MTRNTPKKRNNQKITTIPKFHHLIELREVIGHQRMIDMTIGREDHKETIEIEKKGDQEMIDSRGSSVSQGRKENLNTIQILTLGCTISMTLSSMKL